MGEKKLENSLKLLAKSSIIVFLGIAISKILTYTYTISIARVYGPEVYGLFTLSLMLVGWFTILTKLGLSQGLSRYIPLLRGKKEIGITKYLFKKTILILSISSVVGAITLFLTADFLAKEIFENQELSKFLKIFSFSIPLGVLAGAILAVLRSYEKIGIFVFSSRVLGNSIKLFFLFIFACLGLKYLSVPFSFLTGSFFTLIVSYLILRKSVKNIFTSKIKKDSKILKGLFSYSWPLVFLGFATSILHWTDSLIIGIYSSVEDVGFYNAAIPIAFILTISKDLFVQLFFPLVTKEYSKGNKKLVKQLSQQVGKWILILSLPLFSLIVVFPGVFINLLFGSQYLVAAQALRFLSIGALFVAISEISKELISMKGKSKTILLDILFISLLNLGLNLIFIPRYGITGAGFATMISLVLLSLIFSFQSQRELSILPIRRKMLNIFLASTTAILTISLIKNFIPETTLIIQSTLFIIFMSIYLIMLIVTKALDKNDLLILDIVKKRFSKSFKTQKEPTK
tara:strand:- start:223 stop:1767 length:1545 start_codon:yes stop_codon:yes gene_type:complete